MPYGLTEHLIGEIVETILRHADPERIILFGSRSRGDYDDRSDVDLAVAGVAEPRLLRGFLEEEVRTLRRFDVVNLDDAPASIRDSVNREGVLLYARKAEKRGSHAKNEAAAR